MNSNPSWINSAILTNYYTCMSSKNAFTQFGPELNEKAQDSSVFLFQIAILINLSFPKQAMVFTCLQHESFENTHNKQFLLFPTVFYTRLENFLPLSSNSRLSSATF